MNNKFINLPVDEETIIKFSSVINIEGVDALHQKWRWSGIIAESLIFSAEDIISMNSDEILQLAIKSGLIKNVEKITFKEKDENGFIFVNFNFKY